MLPLEQLVENTADGAFAVDYSRKLSAWNQVATKLFGFTPAEVLGLPCQEVIAGRDDEGNIFCRWECAVFCYAKANAFPPNCNICTRTKAGQALWLNMSVVVIPPHLGTRGHLIHFFRPIDRQKRLEEFVQRTCAEAARLSANAPLPAQPPFPGPLLSMRELEILRLLGSGTPTREIAQTLGISVATVRTHSQNILEKLGVHSKLEAVLCATRHQLLPSGG